MVDVVSALTRKKARLVERKGRIMDDCRSQVREIDAEIADVNKALDLIKEATKDLICPVCRGTGNVRKCDAAGDMDDEPCSACKGTGIKI
jgi:hypothetical protein